MHDRTPTAAVPVEGKKPLADVAQLSMVLVPVVLWIWLCRDWPARLGFFSDDWMVLLHPFAGTADAFHDIVKLTATRPVSAPYIWLAQVFVDWSPFRSQILNAAMLLLSAVSVGWLAAALSASVRGLRTGIFVGACIASAAFIVFPSNTGTFAWGTGVSTAIPALPLFCVSVSLLLQAETSWWRLAVGLALALLSHLSYEAFYFQEVPFILMAATLRKSTLKETPWRTLAGAILVNVACLAFNRLTPGGIQKSFHWDLIHIFTGGYSHILAILGHATREYRSLIASTALVASLSGAICLARLVGARRVGRAFLLIAAGIVSSGLLYASAGYPLAAEGVMARVSIVIATYYAVTAGLLASAVWSRAGERRLLAAVFCLSAATGLIGLELTARARAGEWADTWSYEQARLSRLPEAITSDRQFAGRDQRIYVAIDRGPQIVVPAATAPWEITGAVAWAFYRATNNRLMTADLWTGKRTGPKWFAATNGWFNRWDGQRFEQGFCAGNTVIYGAPGSELWVWQTSTRVLRKVDAFWRYGCRSGS